MTSRRDTLRTAAWFALAMALDHAIPGTGLAQVEGPNAPSDLSPFDSAAGENRDAVAHASNFKAIYGDPRLKAAFFLFLKNVYNLYPEDSFHQLIDKATASGASDRDIYRLVQGQQKTIEPFLADFRYALPALARQKAEMTNETLALLGGLKKINGYMEIGTTGRYVSKLRDSVELGGDLVLVNVTAPGYSPTDLVERGGLRKIGRYVALKDYLPITPAEVPDGTLDLACNFIGFHHGPSERRDGFVRSIHRTLRPGGRLILRDHDVNSVEMNHMVALAHDVFNMGLGVSWDINQREIRHFTSVDEISDYLATQGFRRSPGKRPLLQPGDPTRNALMEFVKV